MSYQETEFANVLRRTMTGADYNSILPLPVFGLYGASHASYTQLTVRYALDTTYVGVMAYGFFTGLSLRTSGLDYLISPTGPNPNNLNSAYYAVFNTENRYINFAENLGKSGEGAAAFQVAYGSMTLQQAAAKAYTAIFGAEATVPPELLTAAVPNGLGGSYTRADYFASYGGDGLNGIGTKAALVGWLLALAAESGQGPYAMAATAYLQDLAPDGQAQFGVNLLATYGPGGDYTAGGRLDPGLPGDTLAITHDQSVLLVRGVGPSGPILAQPAVYASQGNDVVTSTTGLDATNSESFHAVAGVRLGGGNDVLTVTGGFASGLIDAGAGNDTITLSAFNGVITTGAGYDTVAVADFTSAGTGAFGRATPPQIADFTRGQDQLVFADAVGPGRLTPVDVRGAADLNAALATVAANTAAGANTVFEYADATYVFHQNGDPAVNLGAATGSDGLIQLVGVAGATLNARDGHAFDIHFGG